MKIGFGYDIHRFTSKRKLFIGGINIPYKKGLSGHSDADVLLHAIMDSLLGAAGLGDIGQHFPNTDKKIKNISSLKLLNKIKQILKNQKMEIINIDTVVIAEAPPIMKYSDAMKKTISKTLNIKPFQINIKATTNEKLGAIGSKKGIAAFAVCLLSFA